MRSSIVRSALPFIALAALSASCGGSAIEQRPGSGGAGGAATATSGTGATGTCPSSKPEAYAPCHEPYLECAYSCCGDTLQCQSEVWIPSPSDCPFMCPTDLPVDGSSCCRGDDPCAYDLCLEEGAMRWATCLDETWQTTEAPCAVCGSDDVTCLDDEVCVVTSQGFAISYACEPDPCGGEPLTCACAAPVCDGLACLEAMNGTVQCSCINCGAGG